MQRADGVLSRMRKSSVRTTMAGITALVLLLFAHRPARAADAEAKRIFGQRCTACHTFGKGVKVGPDLKGVASRRERSWLLRFVRSSQALIQNRDPIALALFDQFRGQRMPDWTDLSEGQIGAILDWLSAEGPDQKEPDERDAELATAADIERARGLFEGRLPLANGGAACGTCHSLREEGQQAIGGSLGPDLSRAYLKYGERGLTLFLRRPCFDREPESSAPRYLAPDEAFVIKAYLRRAALPASFAPAPRAPDLPQREAPTERPPEVPRAKVAPPDKSPGITILRLKPKRGHR